MKENHSWCIIYWMPYDNNLSHLKSPILNMLAKGNVSKKEVVIFVFSDTLDQESVERTKIVGGEIVETISLGFNDSSDIKKFRTCLLDLQKDISSTRWGLFFLGHGGKLDEISPDIGVLKDNPRKYKWMNIAEIKVVLGEFSKLNSRKIDLLYLQNCCKGTVEAIYNFKQVSKVIISSQKKLGAPNYYYEKTFNQLSNSPDSNEEELSRLILDSESPKMYFSLTAIKTDELDILLEKINALVSYLNLIPLERPPRFNAYSYNGELLVDLDNFFSSISEGDHLAEKLCTEIRQFLKENVILFVKVNLARLKRNRLSGLSVFYPTSAEDIGKYNYLDYYQKVSMDGIFKKIFELKSEQS